MPAGSHNDKSERFWSMQRNTTNHFKLFQFNLATFLLLAGGLLMFQSAAWPDPRQRKLEQDYSDVRHRQWKRVEEPLVRRVAIGCGIRKEWD